MALVDTSVHAETRASLLKTITIGDNNGNRVMHMLMPLLLPDASSNARGRKRLLFGRRRLPDPSARFRPKRLKITAFLAREML